MNGKSYRSVCYDDAHTKGELTGTFIYDKTYMVRNKDLSRLLQCQ